MTNSRSNRQGGRGLLRDSVALLLVVQVANVANFLFHALFGRALPDHEYGLLVFMVNAVLILATPLDALRVVFAHFAARLSGEGRTGDVWFLVKKWAVDLSRITVPIALLAILFSGPLSAFFHNASRVPIVLSACTLMGIVLLPVFVGALQGLHRFTWMAMTLVTWCLVRLLLGGALIWVFEPRATLGMASEAIGVAMSIVIGTAALRRLTRGKPHTGVPVEGTMYYFSRSLLIMTSYAVMVFADILLVKRYLPDAADAVARAGTIARIIVYLPIPVAFALFPKVTSEGITRAKDRRLLGRAIVYVLLLIGGAAGACVLLPGIPLYLLYGMTEPGPELVALVRAYVLAMSPLAFAFLLANFELAQHRFKAPTLLVPCAAGYIIAAAFFHETPLQLAAVLGGASTLSALILLAGLPWKSSKPNREPYPKT